MNNETILFNLATIVREPDLLNTISNGESIRNQFHTFFNLNQIQIRRKTTWVQDTNDNNCLKESFVKDRLEVVILKDNVSSFNQLLSSWIFNLMMHPATIESRFNRLINVKEPYITSYSMDVMFADNKYENIFPLASYGYTPLPVDSICIFDFCFRGPIQ